MSYFTGKKDKKSVVRNSLKHVALMIETSNEYGRGLLRGIRTYHRKHQTWSVYLWEHDRSSTNVSNLKNWNGDGILARIENQQIAKYIHAKGLPTVDLSAGRFLPHLPCVETNDESIALLAYNHLVDKGYRSFAYCGNNQFNWSRHRQNAFSSLIKENGFDCSVFDSSDNGESGVDSVQNRMVNWVKSLNKPCGIMTCYDIKGQRLLEACLIGNIKVPEEIGVIGVDNDSLICELTHPSLTSIRPNSEKTGYEAARLLDAMMAGENVPPKLFRIEPVGIIPRQSTDILYIDNKILSESLKYIRENAQFNIKVQDVLDHVHTSRPVLENLFRANFDRTPHQEIIKIKMDRAKQLLVNTDLSIAIIAERSGFQSSEYFSVAFNKSEKISPSLYRKNAVYKIQGQDKTGTISLEQD